MSFPERCSLFCVNEKMVDYPLQQCGPAMTLERIFADAHQQASDKQAHALCLAMNLKLLHLDESKEPEIWDSIFVVAQTREITCGLIQPIRVHKSGDFTFTGLIEDAWETVGFGAPHDIFTHLKAAMGETSMPGLPYMPSTMLN
jgi:Mlc titration factor MtfA (ptsG expression regulator)